MDTNLIVRDLEKRWGLTLVSFLPRDACARVLALQQEISRLAYGPAPGPTVGEPAIEFYDQNHLHCSHFTLTRSSAWGPVRLEEFIKPDSDIRQLLTILCNAASLSAPIQVRLDRLRASEGKNSIVLLGSCTPATAPVRSALLSSLNQRLPEFFNISSRRADRDPEKYAEVHCRPAFFKRPIADFSEFARRLASLQFPPIECRFLEVSLVHHRYRSLAPPQEGILHIPLGGGCDHAIDRDQLITALAFR